MRVCKEKETNKNKEVDLMIEKDYTHIRVYTPTLFLYI